MEFTAGERDDCNNDENRARIHQNSNPRPDATIAPIWHNATGAEASSSSAAGDNGGLNHADEALCRHVEKEHMFDKIVTPSDVGKLNRLVIPKQHAEKYFPLDSSTNDKGMLLAFEDRNGKPWRFRYSYWNSSQSYVMTKGWSRFVKEKRLDAGDTVSFGRGVGEDNRDRLFIDWRRRPEMVRVVDGQHPPGGFHLPRPNFAPLSRSVLGGFAGGGRLFVPPPVPAAISCNYVHSYSFGPSGVGSAGQPFVYFRNPSRPSAAPSVQEAGDAAGGVAMVLDSVPVGESHAAVKRVRLFGVNLDSSGSEELGRDLQLQPATLQLMETSANGPSSSSIMKGRSLTFDLEL